MEVAGVALLEHDAREIKSDRPVRDIHDLTDTRGGPAHLTVTLRRVRFADEEQGARDFDRQVQSGPRGKVAERSQPK